MKKRIIVVSCMTPQAPSGVVTYYKQLIECIEGYKFILSTPDNSTALMKRIIGIAKRIINVIGSKDLNAFFKLKQYEWLIYSALHQCLKREEYKENIIFHAQDLISVRACRKYMPNAPIIVTAHYNDSPLDEISKQFNLSLKGKEKIERYFRTSFSCVDLVIGVSKYVISKSAFLMKRNQKYHILPNAVDVNAIRSQRFVRKRDKLIITNCGFLDDRKNQKVLIYLANEIVKHGYKNFEIWLIGEGPNKQLYKDLIDELNLNEYVKLLGYVKQPWYLISRSHIYIHTAINDNCPYAVIEALAAGAYVLAADSGGIREILTEEFVISVDNLIPDLLNRVLEIGDVENFEINQNISLNNFSIERWRFKVAEIYNQL